MPDAGLNWFGRTCSGSCAAIRAVLGSKVSRDPLTAGLADEDRRTPLDVPVIRPLVRSGGPLAGAPPPPLLFRLHDPTVPLDVPRWPELVWPNRTYGRDAGITLSVVSPDPRVLGYIDPRTSRPATACIRVVFPKAGQRNSPRSSLCIGLRHSCRAKRRRHRC